MIDAIPVSLSERVSPVQQIVQVRDSEPPPFTAWIVRQPGRFAEQLAEVPAEHDELGAAERVLERVSEQLTGERAAAAPTPGQVYDFDGAGVQAPPGQRGLHVP
ncbi:hypothetical protein [Streptomyces sp. AC512_CC834]|uniref:hypothetical protein n=1 Tax=Streptomyces sp. AC512_CC834 TaxID=2823691 RepID=UPI001C27FE8E|nr:hypothetical protein [Streptomyces sp. AC512_CC834]